MPMHIVAIFFAILSILGGCSEDVDVESVTPNEVILAEQARKILKNEIAGFTKKLMCEKSKKKQVPEKCTEVLDTFNVLIAIKNESGAFKVLKANGLSCKSMSKGYIIACYVDSSGKTNGLNTEFEVAGYKVYAIKRVLLGTFEEVTYTPYSNKLASQEVVAFGKHYLENEIIATYKELKRMGVKSLVNSNAFVYKRVPWKMIESLVLIEHIDVGRFGKEPTQSLMNEVYATLALNQGIAYAYSKSPAQARGLLQVIPSTYEGLKKLYPNAGLIPDFVTGMTNHHNAIKTAILLADHNVGRFPKAHHRALLFSDKAKYFDYVASSYNGDPIRAINLYLNNLDFVLYNDNLENRMYVAKMRAVVNVLGQKK